MDKAFIIVSGSALFVQKRRNAGSSKGLSSGDAGDAGVGVSMKNDAEQAVRELGVKSVDPHSGSHSSCEGTGEQKNCLWPYLSRTCKIKQRASKAGRLSPERRFRWVGAVEVFRRVSFS